MDKDKENVGQTQFYSGIKGNEIMKLVDKWMKLGNNTHCCNENPKI